MRGIGGREGLLVLYFTHNPFVKKSSFPLPSLPLPQDCTFGLSSQVYSAVAVVGGATGGGGGGRLWPAVEWSLASVPIGRGRFVEEGNVGESAF